MIGRLAAGVTHAGEGDGRVSGDGAGPPSRDPVVVLTYAHAGAEVLSGIVSASPSVACTSGTGLLPACHASAVAWMNADGSSTLSALAVKSVRNMAATMITSIQVSAGASRWCETAAAPAEAAATFLRLFPATTFVCLHRSLPGVLAEAAAEYPYGLGGSPFWPYSAGHAGNNIATIASYWAACARRLLEFEAKHPRSCVRIRQEDLLSDPDGQARAIYSRLGLDLADLSGQGHHTAPPPATPDVPATLVPPALRAEINDLHARLDYPFRL